MREIRLNKIYFGFGVIVITLCPFFARASETYLAFSSNAYLKQNAEVLINEEFIYDFGSNAKHGLFRNIPLVYADSKKWFGIQSVSVKNKNNEPYIFELNDPGNFVKIKIGDPHITLTGSHYYNLNYSLINIANSNGLDWKVVGKLREPIAKLQVNLFLPKPVPNSAATATCSLISNEKTRNCDVAPIIKEANITGYKVYIENISNEDVFLHVGYPEGLVFPMPSLEASEYSIKKYYVLVVTMIVLISTAIVLIFVFRKRILLIYKNIKKQIVKPEEYSFLARAMSYNNQITEDDIIATIIDLTERGYLLLEQQPTPVGAHEFIDYSVTLVSEDIPDGAEGVFIEMLNGYVPSLHDWFSNIFETIRIKIESSAKNEIENITIMKSNEELPKLIGFRDTKK